VGQFEFKPDLNILILMYDGFLGVSTNGVPQSRWFKHV